MSKLVYVCRMKEVVAAYAFVELLKKRGLEFVYMTEPMDEYVV